jgi:Spy/CpxP family protein refolding chaperone
MTIKILSLSALALSIALSQSAFASDMCKSKYDWIVKTSEKLDLNAEQKTKIRALAAEAKMAAMAKHEEMRMIHKHINEAYTNNTIDPSKLDEFINQEQMAMGDILKVRSKERYDAYMVLTDSQKQKMNKMVNEWLKSHEHLWDNNN